jgi:hypothetical protein
MHTSYEQRLEFLQQFSDGLELFYQKDPDSTHAKGDGWRISSSKSQFSMLNNALLYTARKEAVDELVAAIATAVSNPKAVSRLGEIRSTAHKRATR